jgi:hypothetical protein
MSSHAFRHASQLLGELTGDESGEGGAGFRRAGVLPGSGGGHDDAVCRLVDEGFGAHAQDQDAIAHRRSEGVEVTEPVDDRAHLGRALRPQELLAPLQRLLRVLISFHALPSRFGQATQVPSVGDTLEGG